MSWSTNIFLGFPWYIPATNNLGRLAKLTIDLAWGEVAAAEFMEKMLE